MLVHLQDEDRGLHGLPDFANRGDLLLVDHVPLSLLVIHRATRELHELGEDGRCCPRRDGLTVLEFEEHVLLQLPVVAHHVIGQLHLHILEHGLRDVEPVLGEKGESDIRNLLLDGFLSTGIRFPVILHEICRVEERPLEVVEAAAKSDSLVDQPDLREQVHQAVGRRCSRHRPVALHPWHALPVFVDAD